MYCPSCDKSYGAVHSRCPECHSWLKVSAPASARKGAKSASGAKPPASPVSNPEQSSVSTLKRDSDFGTSNGFGARDDRWADPAPSSPGGQWEDSESDDDWNELGRTNEVSRPEGWGAASPTPSKSPASGWGGSGGATDGWGGGDSPGAPAGRAESRGGWGGDAQDGWGSSPGGVETDRGASDGWSGGTGSTTSTTSS
ncbi:MAG: hypothetical protein WC314_22355, partial [Vulcanimicrobiota bacterium]